MATCGSRFRLISLGALGGAAVMLLFDPRAGARRRALLRDRLRHTARVGSRQLRRRMRMVPGPLRGSLHTLTERSPWYAPDALPDGDESVKHRVESALGRDRDLPLNAINFDAADGVVRVRGTVPDEEMARRILRRAAAVEGVRAVASLLHTPDGQPIHAVDGKFPPDGRPRAAVQAESVRRRLTQRWPALTEREILSSNGHIDRLAETIAVRAGQPEQEVRAALDQLLLSMA